MTALATRQPRNKLARLPRKLRQVALGMLLDGATAEALRNALRDAGAVEAQLPGNNAVTAYRRSEEYRRARDEWLGLARRAQEKAALATALAQGGVAEAAELAAFEAISTLHEAVQSGEANAEVLGKLAVQVLKLGQESERQTLRAQLAELQGKLAAAAAEQAAGRAPANLAAVAAQMAAMLGVVPAAPTGSAGGPPAPVSRDGGRDARAPGSGGRAA